MLLVIDNFSIGKSNKETAVAPFAAPSSLELAREGPDRYTFGIWNDRGRRVVRRVPAERAVYDLQGSNTPVARPPPTPTGFCIYQVFEDKHESPVRALILVKAACVVERAL
jgi:hypothetical protein